MWFKNYFTSLNSTPTSRRSIRRSPPAARLGIETLEDRRLLAFNPAASYAVGASPSAVVAADFDKDGQVDMVSANAHDNTVSVLLGNSDGTFQPAVTSATGPLPLSLAVGDFDGDEILDLATATYDYYGTGENDEISILIGNGDGTFGPAVSYSIPTYSWNVDIVTGDLDDDGDLDLVLASYDAFLAGYVTVLLGHGDGDGHGDGTFALPKTYGHYYGDFHSPALADLDADGNLDVLVADFQTGSAKILRGNGDGTLQPPINVVTSSGAYSLTVGDFNADGDPDLATAHYLSGVSVALGNGDGTFQAANHFATGGASTYSVTAGDLNGDSALDLILTNDGGVSVLLGYGDGSFAPPIMVAAGTYPVSVVTADVNADDRIDVITANAGSNSVSVLLNDGAWTLPNLPRISVNDVTKNEGNAKTTVYTFTISLSAASSQAVKVNYATANGTAAAGSDYESKTGTVTFAPGEKTKTITVAVNGDKQKEANESFFVNLSGAIGGVITDGQGVGTILNDDGVVKNNRTSFALAVDAAIDDWMFPRGKKRGR